jgi:hypothetical protein
MGMGMGMSSTTLRVLKMRRWSLLLLLLLGLVGRSFGWSMSAPGGDSRVIAEQVDGSELWVGDCNFGMDE